MNQTLKIVRDSSDDANIDEEFKSKYVEEVETIQRDPFQAEITSISNTGVITIEFNREAFLNFGGTLDQVSD